MATERNIFDELTEGFGALQAQREGKRTLRTVKVDSKPVPVLTAQELVSVR